MEPRRKILVLDDSAIARDLTGATLEERGYAVETAGSLAEFRGKLAAFRPDLVVTDLEMPDTTGGDVVRALKQDLGTDRIPVVIFSSRPDAELAGVAARSGADGHLCKGEGVGRLGELVDEIVGSILW
jgi:CheY-like chemotaxis protein